MEILVVGHLSRDVIVHPDGRHETLGGGAAYAMLAPALGAFGAGIVTKVGSDFEDEYVMTLKESNLDLSGLHRMEGPSTRFVNEYDNDGTRSQRVESIAPPILASDFSERHLESTIIHFSPLTPNEIGIECIQESKSSGALTSLDVQGFVRSIQESGVVQPAIWPHPEPILRQLDVVKCHEDELRLVTTGESELAAVTKILAIGPRIVIVTRDRRGSTIYTRNEQVEIPLVLSKDQVDTTGCGDTYSLGFLLEYVRTGSVKRAGLFAATCSSFNVEHTGPHEFPNRSEVEFRMSKYL